MAKPEQYDCAIIGGGIAGLCLAVQLARKGYSVIVFEKGTYPSHKVCGEYVSNESQGFLLRLGLPLDEWELPAINSIGISSEKGFMFRAPLPLGGFGISRYKLDHALAQLARDAGVTLLENTRVTGVAHASHLVTTAGVYHARLIVAAHGKYPQKYLSGPARRKTDNYVGVKYHVRARQAEGRIELHNFEGGYCGISAIESGLHCLCYISHASGLKAAGNSIPRMEKLVLYRNPFLKAIFSGSEFIGQQPVTISNITFSERKLYDDDVIYIGDAAGTISPLTGNGMSMAGRSSVILADLAGQFFEGEISAEVLRQQYAVRWRSAFGARVWRGRQLQQLFGHKHFSDAVLRMINPWKTFKKRLISSTHGVPF